MQQNQYISNHDMSIVGHFYILNRVSFDFTFTYSQFELHKIGFSVEQMQLDIVHVGFVPVLELKLIH